MVKLCFFATLTLVLINGVKLEEQPFQLIAWSELQYISKYTEYGSSGIIQFIIPKDTEFVSIILQATTKKLSYLTFDCTIFDVTAHFKEGSLPVISPESAPFPPTFVNISRPSVISIDFKANQTKNYINITNPYPGNWFGIAFQTWTDPKNDKIQQQGIAPVCECSLTTKVIVSKQNISIIDYEEPTEIMVSSNKIFSKRYKFYVDWNVQKINFNIKVESICKYCDPILITINVRSLPNEENNIREIKFSNQENEELNFNLTPEENTWHYISIDYVPSNKSTEETEIKTKIILTVTKTVYNNTEYKNFIKRLQNIESTVTIVSNITVNKNKTYEIEFSQNKTLNKITNYDQIKKKILYFKSGSDINCTQYDLIKLATGNSFSFHFIMEPDINQLIPKMINLTSQITLLRFDLNGLEDIGGTLYMGFSLNPKRNLNKASLKNVSNYTLLICVRRHAPEIPTLPHSCLFNNERNNASIILNSTSPPTTYENVHLPFPEMGTWFVSIGIFPLENLTYDKNCDHTCYNFYEFCLMNCLKGDVTCQDECVISMNNITECTNCTDAIPDNVVSIYNDSTVEEWNASLIFSLSMAPCVDESCGKFGQCNMYIGSGVLLSACRCRNRYTGWDCSYDAYVHSPGIVLLSTLLLTLSNLVFFISVYFAFKRGYWTEGVVYTFTGFFSTFYHACDSGEDLYTFCLFQRRVLEFCDFYSGLLSIWVTLVAMANLNDRFTSILHMVGAILLAFGTEYNKQGVLVFLLPSVAGVVMILTSWGSTCYKTKECYPAKKYLYIHLPLGAILVVIGLVCFAFLETNNNYKYVHSVWHIIMAVSILSLLPNRQLYFSKS